MENSYHFLLTNEKIDMCTKKPRQARFSNNNSKKLFLIG